MGSSMNLRIGAVGAFIVATFISLTAASHSYDSLCDKMIAHAKEAASAYNRRDASAADVQVALVHKAFEAAVALEPREAQAYLNMAVFLSNTHKYDEAVEMYERSKAILGSSAPKQANEMISRGLRNAKFQKWSKLRDEAYDGGRGNVLEAHRLALLQLSVTFEPHRLNHDLGTLEVMLCETNSSMCASSLRRFKAASYATQGHYFHSRSPDKKGARMPCMHSKIRVGNWSDGVVDVSSATDGVYWNVIKEKARIRGRDGIVTLDDDSHCSLYVPSNDFYTNVAENVLRPDAHPTECGPSVLSLVQFSGAAFYHWMCEALPKLTIAHATHDIKSMKLLLPSLNGKLPSFVTASLDFLFPELSATNRQAHVSHTVAANGLAVVTLDPQPCPAPLEPSLHCASLVSPSAIRALRDLVLRRIAEAAVSPVGNLKKGSFVVLAGRGNDVTMRMFDEPELLGKLEAALAGTGLAVVHFDSAKYSLQEAMWLFAFAAAVVGAHGGALSNIVACQTGAALVEIGFSTVGAQQYSHTAQALGLRFYRVPINPDPLGRALGAPTISFDVGDVVATTLRAVAANVDAREDL